MAVLLALATLVVSLAVSPSSYASAGCALQDNSALIFG